MKKLETLVKTLATLDDAALDSIVRCEDVDVSTLTENERFSVLIFAELEKALKTTDAFLTLDANYAQSKFHQTEQYRVDYYRLVSNDTKNATMIQFYVHANAKAGTCKFRLCTSCARVNREQFEALEKELHFIVKRDTKTHRAKTTERKNIGYDELPTVVKSVCAVLANTRAQRAENAPSAEKSVQKTRAQGTKTQDAKN